MNPKKNVWLAVIAGGQGTRLFPLSHASCPKQFCSLDKENTFIQATIRRFVEVEEIKPTRVVIVTTNSAQTQLAKEQTTSLGVLTQNILQISSKFGYAGAMIKAAEFIKKIDNDAIIINTPADQYIVLDENFKNAVGNAIASAANNCPTIVGVKVYDLNTVMGCGHALYREDDSACSPVLGFVEKPDKKQADKLMRDDNSVCNTGINVWSTETILSTASKLDLADGLSTDLLMSSLTNLKVAVGNFKWYDCGTLQSLYDVSKKTPNHKNASLGLGNIDRVDCRGSLFYAVEGINLRVTGVENSAVLATVINSRIVIAVVKLSDSQRVRVLAEDYQKNEEFLTDDFSVGARNNTIVRTNISKEIRAGFVGVDNCIVYTYKNSDGIIDVAVSQQRALKNK